MAAVETFHKIFHGKKITILISGVQDPIGVQEQRVSRLQSHALTFNRMVRFEYT